MRASADRGVLSALERLANDIRSRKATLEELRAAASTLQLPAFLTRDTDKITPIQIFRMLWGRDGDTQGLQRYRFPALEGKSLGLALAICRKADLELLLNHFSIALHDYNASLMHCPPGSPEEERSGPCEPSVISRLYEKRSRVSFLCGKYQQCIADIHQALRFQFPLNKEYELVRQGICCERLHEFNKARLSYQLALSLCQDKNEAPRLERLLGAVSKRKEGPSRMVELSALPWTPPPKLSYGAHQHRPHISVAISSRFTGKSDIWFATRKIKPGDVLIVEEAYSHRVDDNRCDWCSREYALAVPCSGCALVAYCSEDCRQTALKAYHGWECSVLPLLTTVFNEESDPFIQLYVRMLLKILGELSAWCAEHTCVETAGPTCEETTTHPLSASRLRELLSMREPIQLLEIVLDTMSAANVDIGTCRDRAEKLIAEKSPLADYLVYCLLRLMINEANKDVSGYYCAGGVSTWIVRTIMQLLNWGDLVIMTDYPNHVQQSEAAALGLIVLRNLTQLTKLASDAALGSYLSKTLRAQYEDGAYFRWFFSTCGCREHLFGRPLETTRTRVARIARRVLLEQQEIALRAGDVSEAQRLQECWETYDGAMKDVNVQVRSLCGDRAIDGDNSSASDFNVLLGTLLLHCQYLRPQLVSVIRCGSVASNSSDSESNNASTSSSSNKANPTSSKQSSTKKNSPKVADEHDRGKTGQKGDSRPMNFQRVGLGFYPSVAMIQRCSNFNVGVVYHGTTCVVRALRNIRKGERLTIFPTYQPDDNAQPNEKKVYPQSDEKKVSSRANERKVSLQAGEQKVAAQLDDIKQSLPTGNSAPSPLRVVKCDCSACVQEHAVPQQKTKSSENKAPGFKSKKKNRKGKTGIAPEASKPGEKPHFACPKCRQAVAEMKPVKCRHCGHQIQSQWLDFRQMWSQFVSSSPNPFQLSADLDETVVSDIVKRFSAVDKLIADGHKCRQYMAFVQALHDYYQASVNRK